MAHTKLFTLFLIIHSIFSAISCNNIINNLIQDGKCAPYKLTQTEKPGIIFMHFPSKYWGGIETHIFNAYETVIAQGHPALIICPNKSGILDQLRAKNLNYYVSTNFSRAAALAVDIYKACVKIKAHIVICSIEDQIEAAKIVADYLPIKIIYERHMPLTELQEIKPFNFQLLQNIHAVIGVTKKITDEIRGENYNRQLGIQCIQNISPFFHEDQYLHYKATKNKDSFFLNTCKTQTPKHTTISMIGNMYIDIGHKNHPLLLNAISKLIHEKKIMVDLFLAGSGPTIKLMKALVKSLNIEKYVHFVGKLSQNNIRHLLNYSNMHVLASMREAFGIAHLEAGLMKKPALGAYGTGATDIIIDGVTGLLFKNNDVDDLVQKIRLLIENPELAKQYGENGYNHIREHFSNYARYTKYQQLFKKILSGSKH